MKVREYATDLVLRVTDIQPSTVRVFARIPNHHRCIELFDDGLPCHRQLRSVYYKSGGKRQEAVQEH